MTYGSGVNNYIVQGNIFAYGLTKQELSEIAKNIYNSIGGFSYYPFQAENNGLPYIECGLDAVSYYVVDWKKTMQPDSTDIVYKERQFYVLNRELTGIQALKDSYSAKGEEYQNEFITDLKTQIDLLKNKSGIDKSYLDDNYYNKDYIDNLFENYDPGGGGGGFDVKSVKKAPSTININTVYLIQGEVMVI